MKASLAIITLSTAALFFATPVLSANKDVYYDSAKVIKVEPIYKSVAITEPEEHCWVEELDNSRQVTSGEWRRDSKVGTITGAIIGGVIGNQFGKGRGRGIMTVAGAVLGGAIGTDANKKRYDSSERRVSNRYNPQHTVRHCEVSEQVRYEEQLVGYRVKYRYKGHRFVTRTKAHPGKHIRIKIKVTSVEPMGNYRSDHSGYNNARQWDF